MNEAPYLIVTVTSSLISLVILLALIDHMRHNHNKIKVEHVHHYHEVAVPAQNCAKPNNGIKKALWTNLEGNRLCKGFRCPHCGSWNDRILQHGEFSACRACRSFLIRYGNCVLHSSELFTKEDCQAFLKRDCQ